MEKEKNAEGFPAAKIKISLLICAALFAVGAMVMKNAAFVTVKTAWLAASVGGYELAAGLLGNLENGSERYHEGLYSIAGAMYRRGDYELAYQKFSDLFDYSDSADRVCACRQRLSERMIEAGDYKGASEMLSGIMYYEGSEALYNECQYRYALRQIDDGEWFAGAQILWGIRDYKDSEQRAAGAVLEHTGNEDAESVLGSAKPIPPDVMSDYLRLTDLREQLRDGAVAVGYYHTVGLKKNGTVLSCGDNHYGQCNTAAWENVTQIAAGAYHTVALLKDGTVVACGDNSYKQCNVSKWKNVVQIAATDYNTAALLRDGTVVTCGFNKLPQVKGWQNVERLCTGSYAVCGIDNARALHVTHPSLRLDEELVDAAMSTSYAVGLTVSGDVIYSSDTPTEWKKAAAVYAGGETVGIIDQAMKPSVYNRRKASFYRLPSKEEAVAMSLGGTHFAVLYADGSVYCAGANEYGQCDTGDWNLN